MKINDIVLFGLENWEDNIVKIKMELFFQIMMILLYELNIFVIIKNI